MTSKRKLWNAMLPLMIVLLIAVIMIMSYIWFVSNSIRDQAISDIMELTTAGRGAFDTYISKESELIHYLSLQYSQIDSTDVDSIQKNIKSLDQMKTYYFVINPKTKDVYSNRMENPSPLKDNFDEYSEERGGIISQPADSDFTGARVISCYEVFRFADGVRAVILSEHKTDDIKEEITLNIYGEGGYSNIISDDGKVLIRSGNQNENNSFGSIIDVLKRAGNDESDIQKFWNDLRSGKNGTTQFKDVDGEEYTYSYVPLSKVEGWYFLTMVPNSVIMQHTRKVLVTPQMIILSVVVCLVVIAVLALEAMIHNQTIARKEKEAEFLTAFMTDLSENTSAVFMMLDPRDYSVKYVSRNTERMLGVPAKMLQTDLLALDANSHAEGAAVKFDLFTQVTTDHPVSFDITRVHSVSGEVLNLKETIYRITGNDTEHLLVVISERKKFSRS